MTEKLDRALARLKNLLPLRERQIACGEQITRLHRHILRSFVTRGRMPVREEMAQVIANLDDALEALKSAGMVVFSDRGEPTGAYPFTMEAREHRVRVNGHRVHVMCALDALAVSPMFETSTQIESRCGVTGDRVDIRQSAKEIESPDAVADLHLGIDWGAADAETCCANSLCRQMIFLRNGDTARRWVASDSGNRETFTLPEAVEFAQRFFAPLVAQ